MESEMQELERKVARSRAHHGGAARQQQAALPAKPQLAFADPAPNAKGKGKHDAGGKRAEITSRVSGSLSAQSSSSGTSIVFEQGLQSNLSSAVLNRWVSCGFFQRTLAATLLMGQLRCVWSKSSNHSTKSMYDGEELAGILCQLSHAHQRRPLGFSTNFTSPARVALDGMVLPDQMW